MPELSPAWQITVDRELCMGSGLCVTYAPATFVHDTVPKAVVLDPPHDAFEMVTAAVEACPMAALRVIPTDQGA